MTRDPRSEAEKARAALARNAEMGWGVPKGPVEQQPPVTPEPFGDPTETGRVRSNLDETPERIAESRDIGDSTGTTATSRDIPVPRQNVKPPPTHRSDEEDNVLSRAKE